MRFQHFLFQEVTCDNNTNTAGPASERLSLVIKAHSEAQRSLSASQHKERKVARHIMLPLVSNRNIRHGTTTQLGLCNRDRGMEESVGVRRGEGEGEGGSPDIRLAEAISQANNWTWISAVG